jgi:hypothetical protein
MKAATRLSEKRTFALKGPRPEPLGNVHMDDHVTASSTVTAFNLQLFDVLAASKAFVACALSM